MNTPENPNLADAAHAEMSKLEPWLRGTHTALDALRRQVLHALELATEDIQRWCLPLSDAELNLRPLGLPSVAFQVRHTGRSLDRLLSYAEGHQLGPEQHAELASEHHADATRDGLALEFERAMANARQRVLGTEPTTYEEVRGVGRDRLPTTVGGLLIHCAEHTQRHTGQAITTAKVVTAGRLA